MAEQAILSIGDKGGLATTNPAAVYLASLAPTGRASMTSSLGKVAGMLGFGDWQSTPWHLLEYEHAQAIRTKLIEDYAPATCNRVLTAIKRTMREAFALGLIDADALERIRLVRPVTGETLPAGRALGPGELAAIMRECVNDPTPAGARDAAVIALAYGAGLRRAELASLELDELAQDDSELITVKLTGKRRKERLVYLDNGAADAMRAWLDVRGDDPGPLFWRGKRGGRLTRGQGLTAQAVRDIIVRRSQAAGVVCTPHDLRRSFITDLLDAGTDIGTVADLAGHKNLNTTRRYDRRGERAKRRAVRALHVPYTPRRLA